MANSEALGIPRRRRNGRRIGIGAVVAVLIGLFSSARGLAFFYTDFLWFKSVQLTSVWSTVLESKIILGALSIALLAGLIWINLFVVDRFAPRTVIAAQPDDEFARRYQEFVRPRAGLVRLIASLVLGVMGGVGFYNNWGDWLLFRNGGKFGTKDPLFHKDVGFFVFKLPFLNDLVEWWFGALVFIVIIALAAHYLQGGIRPQVSKNRVTSGVRAHVSILLGLLAVVRALQYLLDRYKLSYSTRGVVTGANYTDVKYLMPGLMLLFLISLLAAVLFFGSSRTRGWRWPVTTVVLWAFVSILVAAVIPAAVQTFSVKPAESQKEQPYIKRNIDATRQALGLQSVQVNNFQYTSTLQASDLQANSATIRNVRLWDPTYLLPSYKRLQETRSFFQFNDIDVDRYPLNGDTTQMMLSVRELNTDGLPQGRTSWVGQHLQYTHGDGAVASPANAVTSEGGPAFTLQDLPPAGAPQVSVPQVYFSEHTSDYSVVNTKQGEVDYVSLDGRDRTSSYAGKGGVQLSSLLTKAAFALRVNDINPLISGLVTDQSKAMYLTNIRDRVEKVAPFLRFDADPYPVILDGRIEWVQDAYTVSDSYPYGQDGDTSLVDASSDGLSTTPFNYVRNSVKIVTDAYDGTMKFYVFDKTDPVIKAWSKTFPKLFVDSSSMPPDLLQHVRYPEDLFRVQSQMFGSYHLTNPQDFYSKSDRWNIAQKPEFGTSASVSGEQRIEPYYLLMRLPGEQQESFLMFVPFVPYSDNDSRKELSAFMVAKSDAADYGKMSAFVMPRDQQIDGPALVEARIQQEPSISQYITLLNQSGSQVQLGNMLIIPIDQSLLYVRPLYVASQQTQVPEFKKAIVVQGSKVVMADTLQQALTTMFGSAPSTLEQAPSQSSSVSQPGQTPLPGQTPASSATALPANAKALLDQANAEFGLADQALHNGDLAGYQLHVQKGVTLTKQARGG